MFWFLRHLSPLSLIPAIAWVLSLLLMSSASATAYTFNSENTEFSQSELVEVVICTPDGFKTVMMTPDGEIQGEGEAYPDCSWCQKFQIANISFTNNADALKILFVARAVRFAAFVGRTHGLLPYRAYTSRAPPSLI